MVCPGRIGKGERCVGSPSASSFKIQKHPRLSAQKKHNHSRYPVTSQQQSSDSELDLLDREQEERSAFVSSTYLTISLSRCGHSNKDNSSFFFSLHV